jgi:hypothetical protein
LASVNIDFYDDVFHVNVGEEVSFIVFEFVEVYDGIVVVSNSNHVNDLKAFLNYVDIRSPISHKHVGLVMCESPSLLIPTNHFLELQLFGVDINLVFPPSEHINEAFELGDALTKYLLVHIPHQNIVKLVRIEEFDAG